MKETLDEDYYFYATDKMKSDKADTKDWFKGNK